MQDAPGQDTRTSQRSVEGYNRLAPNYRKLEYLAFGSALMGARVALLERLPPLDRVLILGEGDGRLLEVLLRNRPRCQVTCVEQSPRMVELAQARLAAIGRLENVHFAVRDALTFVPERRSYDAIVTSFFLDCFTKDVLKTLIPTLLQGLKRGGLWYYADFHMPSQATARVRAEVYLALLHTFFRWRTGLRSRRLVDPAPIFAANGLSLEVERQQSGGLLTTRLYRY